MKKTLLLFALFLFAGCTGMQKEIVNIEPNTERVAGIGDLFFKYEFLTSPARDSMRFELTIVELNEQKIGLQYNEYIWFMADTSRINLSQPSGWAIKEGFNKRFDYPSDVGTITFKGYEFEVLSIEKGKIKYKRVK